MACGDYSNHCNASGATPIFVVPYTHTNSCAGGSGFTNASECGGSYTFPAGTSGVWNNVDSSGGAYHVDNSVCYQNVAYNNHSYNRNWSYNPGTTVRTDIYEHGDTCSWTGNACEHGNTCLWLGNSVAHSNTCAHGNTCQYGDTCGFGNFDENPGLPNYNDFANNCYTGYPNSCATGYPNACGIVGFGDDCAIGYPNACDHRGWGDDCGSGYSDANYYYANHYNYPFNNFCNHSNVFY